MDDIAFRLNGQRVSLSGAEPGETLLRWLQRRRLTGTKEGCADGDCGACTVALIERDGPGQSRYQAVNSCLLPLGLLPGRELLTVEALAEGESLHPVQQALVECAGSQCGYCTPGFVMSLFADYYAGVLDDQTIEGNLCRCTGYQPIRAAMAALRARDGRDDRFSQRLQAPHDPLAAAELGHFFSPTSIEAALALKAQYPSAQWFAGGTDLGVRLSHGQDQAANFIALDRVADLRTLEVQDSAVRIGAAVTLSSLQSELAGLFPALDQMLPWFAGQQIRNRATLGGNLGTASPIGDLLPVLLALDAELEIRGPRGSRRAPIDGFFVDYREIALSAEELIVAVQLPRRPGRNGAYKVAKRQTDDISIVAAAFALDLDDRQRVSHARLAYGGVAAIPLRARSSEALLLGQPLSAATLAAVGAQLRQEFTPLDDHRGSASYRRQLCAGLFEKFVSEAGLCA